MKRSVWHAVMQALSASGCMLALLALTGSLNEVFMNGRGPEESRKALAVWEACIYLTRVMYSVRSEQRPHRSFLSEQFK